MYSLDIRLFKSLDFDPSRYNLFILLFFPGRRILADFPIQIS